VVDVLTAQDDSVSLVPDSGSLRQDLVAAYAKQRVPGRPHPVTLIGGVMTAVDRDRAFASTLLETSFAYDECDGSTSARRDAARFRPQPTLTSSPPRFRAPSST
jgi:hypothetical protein